MSVTRIFDHADVLQRLREIHGPDYLQGLQTDGPSGWHERIHEPLHEPMHDPIREQIEHLRFQERDSREAFGRGDGSDASANLSTEEHLRSKRLHELLMDRQESWRAPLVATSPMIAAITGLTAIAPQFSCAIGVMANAACQSALTGLPLRLPPILLLGQPGIGKTFFGRRLAAALGTMLISLPMNLTPAFGLMAGLSPAWRGAAPGKIATTLLASPTTSPLILFDEIDKVVVAGAHDRPLDVLHSLWEPENAVSFRDEYYDIPFEATGIISIATANCIDGIPASLLDRLLVLEIRPPTFEERLAIAQQAYAAATRRLTQWTEPTLRPEVAARLAQTTPRRITRLLGLALPLAFAARRDALSITDIATAALLLDSAKEPEPPPIGFRPVKHRPDDAA